MATDKPNVGANSIDGINANVGITYLPSDRTLLMMPLQGEDCPTDPEEMIIQGDSTFSVESMFKLLKPQTDVTLKTGDEHAPTKDENIKFNNLSDFDPSKIMDQVPLLRTLKDQQSLIKNLEILLQQSTFQKLLQNKDQKEALIGFLQSVIVELNEQEK